MDYAHKLARLEHLRHLVEQWIPLMYGSGEEGTRLHKEICEVYGEVADVFEGTVGRQKISVPSSGAGPSIYANFFEAGFLSGRTFHTHQGQTELLKVIGQIKRRIVSEPGSEAITIWGLIHPAVVAEAKARFDSGHYADSAEAAMKAVNARVKKAWIASGHDEKDGKPLMLAAFSVNSPAIRVDDLSTESGRNIQEGYMHLFAGAMQGIRNPKAHSNLVVSPERALHFLMLASLLMSVLDEVGAAA